MKCTSCNIGELIPAYLEKMFPCHTCNHCGGNWINLPDYLRWLEHAEPPSETCQKPYEVEAQETERAMLCPVTDNLMLKYRISKDTSHRLDLSSAINGVWMDRGEWELIKQAGLAFKLNAVFTEPWQRKIRDGQARDTFAGMYAHKFGEESYGRVKAFREWLDEQDLRSYMLAYLAAEDPYSASR